MFNFSAHHLFLLSPMEYNSCALLLMLDHDTRRVYRLLDFTKRLRPIPGKAYCLAGKVNSVHTLYLVVESIKLDSKHQQPSIAPPHDDGADGQLNALKTVDRLRTLHHDHAGCLRSPAAAAAFVCAGGPTGLH